MLPKLTEPAIEWYWYKLMSEAELTLNNSIHKSTDKMPSRLLVGVNKKGKVDDGLGDYLKQAKSKKQICDLKKLTLKEKDKIERLQKYY